MSHFKPIKGKLSIEFTDTVRAQLGITDEDTTVVISIESKLPENDRLIDNQLAELHGILNNLESSLKNVFKLLDGF